MDENSMKKLVLILYFIPMLACAQIEAVATSPRQNFLLYEPVELTVQLKNTSGSEIVFNNGDQNNHPWLSFLVFRADGEKVRSDNLFLPASAALAAGEQKQFLINITPWYRMRETGSYQVQTVVSLGDGKTFLTQPFQLNIGAGNIISQTKKVIQGVERVYSLISYFDQQQLRLYLRVEDPLKNIVYSTSLLDSYNPSLKIIGPLFDSQNRIHILHPRNNAQFCYTMADQDGNILRQDQVPLTVQLLQKENGDIELQSLMK